MTMKHLRMDSVDVRFGKVEALSGVALELHGGEVTLLAGPNGSGKSTLMRLLAGLATPLAGRVDVLGEPAGSRGARRATGFVPETLTWPRALTVNDALTELASLSSGRDIVGRVDRAVEVLGLAHLLGRRLGSLSYGQSRRVLIAQALLDDPPLLLLDEAFSGLDSLVLHRLRQDLGLRLAGGAAVVLASHRLDDLAGLATHVLVLRDGRVIRSGLAEEVLVGTDTAEGLAALLEGPA